METMPDYPVASADMTRIRLLVVVADAECRRWLKRALSAEPAFVVVGVLADVEQSDSATGNFPNADVLVVDLTCTTASPTRFWAAVHLLHRGTRIVCVTAPSLDKAILQAGLHARVDAFVDRSDPNSANQLHEMIRALYLGESLIGYLPVLDAAKALFDSPHNASLPASMSALRLDRQTRQAQLNDHCIPLTPLEFDMLAHLSANAGRPVPIPDLLSQVWHCSLENGGTAAQVKVCIARIRRKIEPDPQRPRYSLTARNGGYYVPPNIITVHEA